MFPINIHKDSKYKDYLPSYEELTSIKVNDLVEVTFELKSNVRLVNWVKITSAQFTPSFRYTGTLIGMGKEVNFPMESISKIKRS